MEWIYWASVHSCNRIERSCMHARQIDVATENCMHLYSIISMQLLVLHAVQLAGV